MLQPVWRPLSRFVTAASHTSSCDVQDPFCRGLHCRKLWPEVDIKSRTPCGSSIPTTVS
jgi:hypothetical protein